ncbi:MAG: ComC/BlpC family leader-containing pheromone/bacteriocin [Nitrosomonas sp.]|nr:ComC/BlpC family leader-containing pheromone/bacteriocin [Nitrosomonas sp.]MBK7365367.1 ComC/BlpC family leader-containing pheromone/bacteriocin [Nitrosomonas sp.]
MDEFNFDEMISLDDIEVHTLTTDELNLITGGMMKMDEGFNETKLASYKDLYGEVWF